SVLDRPGVLARIATLFSEHGVSVEAVQQSVTNVDPDGHEANTPGATLVIGTHRATEAALAATVAALAASPVVARVETVRRVEGQEENMAHQWRGVLREYADRLDVSDATPVITLGEGGTPLIPAAALSARTGTEVWVKFEGMNPTGSFKDRGMTMAVS